LKERSKCKARVYSLIFRIEQILIKENPRKAGEILREAAEMGNLPSQESLSFLYLKNWDNAKSTDSTNDEMIDFMENNAEYFTQLAAKQNN
jgi:TPR repeat protein